MAGELGQQTVEPMAVVRRAAEESYVALREPVEKSRAEAQGKGEQQRSDTEKKIDLLKFIDRTPSGPCPCQVVLAGSCCLGERSVYCTKNSLFSTLLGQQEILESLYRFHISS